MSNTEEGVHLRKYLTGIIGNAPFGIVTLSVDLEVGIINANAVQLLGFKNRQPESLVDCKHESLLAHAPKLLDEFNQILNSHKKRQLDLFKISINQYTVNIKIRELFNGTLIIIEDITKQAELEKRLLDQATHDSLTKLYNRQEFEDCTEKYIKKAYEHKLPGAIIFIDLDRFKPVNDTAGHAAGDELLIRVANILRKHIRERDILARIGGDEFAILLEDCPLSAADKIANLMRKDIDKFTFVFGEHSFNIGMSAGIAAISDNNKKLSDVITAADNACQIAKNEGRNRIHVASLDEHEYQQHQQQIAWLPKINKAINSNEFILFAQEIRALETTSNDKHYELLIRLKNKDGSITSPNAFIPAAERYDLMPKIDRCVLEMAFANMQRHTSYSINLSGQSASDITLGDFILDLQKTYNINAEKITLEITETAAIQNIEKFMALMSRLKRAGFKFSLDDFGSGLSSFTYLKTMPVDYLKIDGSFVKEIVTDSTAYAMVKSINEVGHTMGLKTIAEFVESAEILSRLKEIGVDYAQGYHLHKPQDLIEINTPSSIVALKRIKK